MFTYIDKEIPNKEIIKSAYRSLTIDPIIKFSHYHLHKCDYVLLNFLKRQFNDSYYKFGVQRILKNQQIHIDVNRKTVYN